MAALGCAWDFLGWLTGGPAWLAGGPEPKVWLAGGPGWVVGLAGWQAWLASRSGQIPGFRDLGLGGPDRAVLEAKLKDIRLFEALLRRDVVATLDTSNSCNQKHEVSYCYLIHF